MSEDALIAEADGRMDKTVASLRADFAKVRTGRAHAGLLDHLTVACYGAAMPLNQVATVSAGDAHSLLIAPFDKQNMAAIEKAVRESDLGLNPAAEAGRIRVAMPPLSEERRRELVKVVKREAEAARVAARNIRRDAVAAARDKVKKGELSEDQGRRLENRAQEITDRHIKQIDEMAADKEAELLQV